jgi:hypothetical protein
MQLLTRDNVRCDCILEAPWGNISRFMLIVLYVAPEQSILSFSGTRAKSRVYFCLFCFHEVSCGLRVHSEDGINSE